MVFCAAGCGAAQSLPSTPFLRCDRCLDALYCSRECQIKAWPEHKEPCKLAIKSLELLGNTIEDADMKVKVLKRHAEAGNAVAQCCLGMCLMEGSGVAMDKHEAFKWYLRAAESGNATGQFNCGLCYEVGTGVAKDEGLAVKWYTKAARIGDNNAQDALERLQKLKV